MRFKRIALSLDLEALKEIFATWTTLQKWDDVKLLYDIWLTCYDKNGKQNVPDLGLFNNYLRANLMSNASPVSMRELASTFEAYGRKLNTASHNLILEAMLKSRDGDIDHALNYLDGMIEMGEKDKDSKPDEESFELVIRMLLPPIRQYQMNQMLETKLKMEAAYKYIDLNLKSGYSMSQDAFNRCVWNFMNFGSLDTLVSIIERCKKMDQNKALVADWKLCLEMLEHAMKADNSELAFNALFFMAQWMKIGLNTRPPRYLFVEEGLVVSLLATARRTYSKKLLEASLSILNRSLCRNKVASAETYIARIHALASQVHLPKAFDALFEFESLYGGSDKQAEEDLFSPFTALNPLVVACSQNGYATLDSVYFQLENLSKKNPLLKSVAALNCIILGCANIWDAERASQTFEAMSTFGLTPDINSYNGLICAYGKSNQREKALELFEQLKGLGIKPNATTYALLVDAHLIAKDPTSALAIIDEMVISGFKPTKEILKKVRRRCIRMMDYESDDKVEALAKDFGIRMGTENRRNLLFNLQYSAEYLLHYSAEYVEES